MLGIDRFLPIPILTDFEDFKLTDTDFQNQITYRYRFYIPKKEHTDTDFIHFTDTDFSKFSERSVQYLGQARFKQKEGVSLARLCMFWITRSVK